MADPMSAYDQRVRELSRLPKTRLAALYGSRHTFVYLAAPLVKWSKDELISSILADEFGLWPVTDTKTQRQAQT